LHIAFTAVVNEYSLLVTVEVKA